jgi:hypothetical protein
MAMAKKPKPATQTAGYLSGRSPQGADRGCGAQAADRGQAPHAATAGCRGSPDAASMSPYTQHLKHRPRPVSSRVMEARRHSGGPCQPFASAASNGFTSRGLADGMHHRASYCHPPQPRCGASIVPRQRAPRITSTTTSTDVLGSGYDRCVKLDGALASPAIFPHAKFIDGIPSSMLACRTRKKWRD